MYLDVRKPPLRSKFYWNPFSFPDLKIPHRPPHASHLVRPHLRLPFDQDQHPPYGPFTHPTGYKPTWRAHLLVSTKTSESLTNDIGLPLNGDEKKEYIEHHKTWWGKLMFWERPPTSLGSITAPGTTGGTNTPLPSRTPSTNTPRGRASRSGTPPTGGDGIMMKQRDKSGSLSVRQSPRLAGRRRDSGSETDMRTAVLERSVS